MKNKKIKKEIILEEQLKNNTIIDIPVEHQKIVLDRMAKAKTNPKRILDWDEVSKDL